MGISSQIVFHTRKTLAGILGENCPQGTGPIHCMHMNQSIPCGPETMGCLFLFWNSSFSLSSLFYSIFLHFRYSSYFMITWAYCIHIFEILIAYQCQKGSFSYSLLKSYSLSMSWAGWKDAINTTIINFNNEKMQITWAARELLPSENVSFSYTWVLTVPVLLFLKDLLWETQISKSVWVFCELHLKMLLIFFHHPAWNLFIFTTCYGNVQIRKPAE